MGNGSFTYKINDDMPITLTKEIVEKNCAGGKKITDEAYTQFAALCKQHKLNPFTREAHIVVMEKANGECRFNIMIGKDGYFKMADSNPNYDGMQDGIVIEDKNGNIQYPEGCFVPPGCKLLAGWAKAYSKERKYPKYAVCSMAEYKGSDKSLWATKPATMINKVAKCMALRDLFPQTYNGTYDESEITDVSDENENQTQTVETKPTTVNKTKTTTKNTTNSDNTVTVTSKKVEAKSKTGTTLDLIPTKDALATEYVTKGGKKTFQQIIQECLTSKQQVATKNWLMELSKAENEYTQAARSIFVALTRGEICFPTC